MVFPASLFLVLKIFSQCSVRCLKEFNHPRSRATRSSFFCLCEILASLSVSSEFSLLRPLVAASLASGSNFCHCIHLPYWWHCSQAAVSSGDVAVFFAIGKQTPCPSFSSARKSAVQRPRQTTLAVLSEKNDTTLHVPITLLLLPQFALPHTTSSLPVSPYSTSRPPARQSCARRHSKSFTPAL